MLSEKLLQFLWNYKIFTTSDFKDLDGNFIEILDYGKWNQDSGPDFLMAKIKMNNLTLVGNIELHLKSSDWIFHRHQNNPEYENIILHLVFQNDLEIKELADKNIPTIELKNYIDEALILKYQQLSEVSNFIACEKIIKPENIPFYFSEEQLLKKLDEKSIEIEHSLERFKNDYEAVLFHYLAYAFGLKINADIFKELAESIDFMIINKIKQNAIHLEALFFGLSGWLEHPKDEKMIIWKREFDFLKAKYKINNTIFRPKFLRLRPPNFPTIRLSQFANLYHQQPNLFSKIIKARDIHSLLKIFENVKASEYWDNRFNFGKEASLISEKFLSKSFVELLLINAILPLKYTYHKYYQEDIAGEILEFYRKISSEENMITKNWKSLKIPIKNGLESQAFIYHYKNFCEAKKCLNCSIGIKLLK